MVQELADEQGYKVAQNVAAGVTGIVIWPLWRMRLEFAPLLLAADRGPAAGVSEAPPPFQTDLRIRRIPLLGVTREHSVHPTYGAPFLHA